MTSAVRRLICATVFCATTVPMLAACGSGRSPASVVTSMPDSSSTVDTADQQPTTTNGTTGTTASNSGASTMPGSTGSSGQVTTAPTTTLGSAGDAQLAGLEQTLNEIDTILGNLDKSLAGDATLAP